MATIGLSDALSANYERYYHGRSEWRELGARSKVDNLVALSGQYPHRTILELGSGEGAILQRLNDIHFGEELYSLEISPTALDAIRQRGIPSLTECSVFDGYSIPYENDRFDLAILSHVVEHLEHPRKLLYEARRVAKYVFVEVPLEDHWRLGEDFVFSPVGHINFYSAITIRRLLQTCGLEVLHQLTTNAAYDAYRYVHGRQAALRYWPKEILLKMAPRIAARLWTYNGSLMCQRSDEIGTAQG